MELKQPRDFSKDVRFLLHLAKHGPNNRLYESMRLIESAEHLDGLELENADLKSALLATLEFMDYYNANMAALLEDYPRWGQLMGLLRKAVEGREAHAVEVAVEIPSSGKIADATAVSARLLEGPSRKEEPDERVVDADGAAG